MRVIKIKCVVSGQNPHVVSKILALTPGCGQLHSCHLW